MEWRRRAAQAAVVLVLACRGIAGESGPRGDAWVVNPVLRGMMEWTTFYLTFDGGSMLPEMAAGNPKPSVGGAPLFAPGLRGLALVAGGAGGGNAWYSNALNFPIGSRGAMAVWVCPVEWTHVNGGNTVFAMTGNSTFYIERQGPAHNERGELRRAEGVLFLANTKSGGVFCINADTRNWPAGKWRLLVANWNWPEMSFSVDGGAFGLRTLKARPDAKEFGALVVGSIGGEKTLMDEIMIFRRPLTQDECRELYRAFAADGKGETE